MNSLTTRPPLPGSGYSLLPPDDDLRVTLHDEVHSRPAARVRLPALIIYVAVLNEDVSREQELAHLRRLPGQDGLTLDDLRLSFLRLRFADHTLKWERHTEFTRYTLVQALPPGVSLERPPADLLCAPVIDPGWLRAIPGRTVAAIELALVHGDLPTPERMEQAQAWFGGRNVVASHMGSGPQGHSWVMTQLRIGSNGFERILVVAPESTTATRGGRISQRLLELETYRLMALRGLPAAKRLGPMLGDAERELSEIAAQMENESTSDEALLHDLVSLAARIERATAENVYRFAATRSYASLVGERITELRETPIPGTPTISAFMQRRFSPAMLTVQSAAQRLTSLSERVARTSALLRTRVDIATEVQNRQLLEKLTRGQELQLKLQSTVEGLSIAAISYYVVSLVLYGGKALKGAGVPLNPEVTAGAMIPLVLWAVWRTVQHIHAKLHTH